MTNNEKTPTLRDQFAMAVAAGLVSASEIHPGCRDSSSPMERRKAAPWAVRCVYCQEVLESGRR